MKKSIIDRITGILYWLAAASVAAAIGVAAVNLASPPKVPDRSGVLAVYIVGNNPQITPEYATRLAKAMVREADRVGIDVASLAATGAIESHFRPDLTSIKGAKGVMQIMPFWTKEKDICKIPEWLLYDAETSVQCGANILKHYSNQAGGIETTFSYYYAGPRGYKLEEAKQYAVKVSGVRNRLCMIEPSLCKVNVEKT